MQLRSCFLTLLALFGSFSMAEPTPRLPREVAQGYVLKWQDEFDGDSVNKTEWTFRNDERFASRNLPQNVAVADGKLRIALKKEKNGKLDYTAGGVISKREFKYGYYEASFKSPAGAGWHTSFWMMKTTPGQEGNRQEIDVCEHDSKDQTSYGANLHIHKPEHKGIAGRRISTPDLSKEFHTFGCEFTPQEIRHYFDGKLVGVMRVTSFRHDVMSIWLTVVGWSNLPWAPQLKIDDTKLPAFAEYEYVRFYEKAGLEKEAPQLPRTVVVFGDSLTEGGALPKDQRDQAWVRIVERESKGALKVVNEGKGGRAAAAAKSEFEAMWARQPRADVMVIALGTNDSRDITGQCIPKAVASVRYMIDRARQAYGPAIPILLLGPPNLNKSALGPTKGIATEREANLKDLGTAFAALAKEKNADYLSLFGTVPEENLTKDGVHPDAAGNAALAKVIGKSLMEISKK